MTWPASVAAFTNKLLLADLAIVADVRVRKKKVFVADARDAAALSRSAAHGHIFAKNIFVADNQFACARRECVVLRVAANHTKRMKHIRRAELRRAVHAPRADEECNPSPSSTSSPTTANAPTFTPRPSFADVAMNARADEFPARSFLPASLPFLRRGAASRSTILHISVASAAKLSVHRRLAFQLAEIAAPGEHLHFKPQLISRHHRTPESRAIHRHKKEQLVLAVRNFQQQQQSAGLRHRFDDQHAGHNRLPGKWP